MTVEVGVPAAGVVELAADAREPAVGRVDVRVLEAGRDGAAAQLDVARAGADEAPHIAVAADGDDPAAADGERLRPGPGGVGGEDAAPGQDEIGVLGVGHGAEHAIDRFAYGGVLRRPPRRGCPLLMRWGPLLARLLLREAPRWRILGLVADVADLVIRRASVEDVDAICDLHLRSWQAFYRGLIPDGVLHDFVATQDDRRERRRLQVADPGSGVTTWVAVDRTLIVGAAWTNRSRDVDAAPGTGEVSALYVLPGFVGRGVGRSLLEQCGSLGAEVEPVLVRDVAEGTTRRRPDGGRGGARDRSGAMTAPVRVLLHAGYAGDRVGSSIVLVRDADALIVVDPGMVARRSLILEPLAGLGVAPEAVTHVFLSHHHPDHTINIALFPNAEVVDFWARYKDDLWLDHDGDGYRLSPKSQLWLTPGHTEEDATLVVEADDAVYAMTHLWWREDRTPEVDPLGVDQAAIEAGRARVLAVADIVIPGHGGPFRVDALSAAARSIRPGRSRRAIAGSTGASAARPRRLH